MYTDKFGFVPYQVEVEWMDGRVWPVSEFEESRQRLDEFRTQDRYFSPPSGGGRLPLYKLPPSHHIEVPRLPGQTPDEIRTTQRGAGGFLIHLIGLLFGHRCQFRGWWVDGKTYLGKLTDYYVPPKDAGKCIDRALEQWRQWNPRSQRIAQNALLLFGQTKKYVWLWEQFQAEYQVMDAAFKIARMEYSIDASWKQRSTWSRLISRVRKRLGVGQGLSHGDRMNALCHRFALAKNPPEVRGIVRLRNDLVHEAVWAGDAPGWPPSDIRAHYTRHLHQFSQRLFLALFGIEADYVHSDWWGFNPHHFVPRL